MNCHATRLAPARIGIASVVATTLIVTGCTSGAPKSGELRPDGRTRYHIADRLGSAALVADAAGTVVARSAHTPYGTKWIDWRADGERGPDYRFTGHEDDPISSSVHAGARQYLPALGRWASPDPRFLLDDPDSNVTIVGQANPYQYAANDPLNRTDPEGEVAPIIVALGIGAGVGAAVGIGAEVLGQLTSGGDFDLRKVGTAGLQGAATGAATVANPILGSAVGSGTSVAKTYVDRKVFDGEDPTTTELVTSGVIGGIPTPGATATGPLVGSATTKALVHQAASELGDEVTLAIGKQIATSTAANVSNASYAGYSEPEATDPSKLCSGC